MIGIYVPGSQACDQDALRAIGCSSLFDALAAPMFVDAAIEGPDGGTGRLAYIDSHATGSRPIVTVDMQTQQWSEAARCGELKRGRYWLGVWSDAKPTPIDLCRPTTCDGTPMELGDGNEWVIPIADFLPKRLTVDKDTGSQCEVVKDEYLKFTKRANSLFEHFLSEGFLKAVDEGLVAHVPEGLSFASDALEINYRVNCDLVDLLGLVGQYDAFAIAEASTGIQMIRAAAQKKTLLSEICAA